MGAGLNAKKKKKMKKKKPLAKRGHRGSCVVRWGPGGGIPVGDEKRVFRKSQKKKRNQNSIAQKKICYFVTFILSYPLVNTNK